MIDDPIVADVRRIRQEHAAKFGYDLNAIYEDLKRREAASGRKYVNFPPRRVTEAKSSTTKSVAESANSQ